ncbi:MAG: c-type cytochrome [Hyphomonas sp.]
MQTQISRRWGSLACLASAAAFLWSCSPQNSTAAPNPVPAKQASPPAPLVSPSGAMRADLTEGAVGTGTLLTADAERGRKLYMAQCGACHSLDQNRVGPRHRGIVGRKAGSVPDFRYSPALQKLDLVWNADTLDTWLQNPSAVAPGTSMGFRVRKPEDRAAIVSFLESMNAQ